MRSLTRTSLLSRLMNSERRLLLLFLLVPFLLPFLICFYCAAGASAAVEPAPAWSVQARPAPSSFSSAQGTACEEQPLGGTEHGGCDGYVVVLTNVGARSSGGPVTVIDTLPAGIVTVATPHENGWACSAAQASGHEVVTCTTESEVRPLDFSEPIALRVEVTSASGTPVNRVEAFGGGAPSRAVAETPTPIDAATEPFGVREFSSALLDSTGADVSQAASHSAGFTASFAFPSAFSVRAPGTAEELPFPVQEVNQIAMDLPPGVIGDALAAPTCSESAAADLVHDPEACPGSTVIGNLDLFEKSSTESEVFSIYNVTPERGFPAEFAVYDPDFQRSEFLFASLVGSGADSHVRVISGPQAAGGVVVVNNGVSLTFFGDPHVMDGTPLAPQAFFTAPSDCQAPGFTSTIYVDSWQDPGRLEPDGQPDLSDPNWKRAQSTMPPVTGCEALQFHPSLSVAPTATGPDEPTGINAALTVPQNEDPNGLATPPLKDASVTLPEGLVVSPSSATGLEGCTPAQIDLESPVPGTCPLGSEIGEVTVHTPLLEEPLKGPVFVGTPECDPCTAQDAKDGRMIHAYIQVTSERYGTTVKIPGNVFLDPATGRVTTTFDNAPQQPFSSLEFKFKEGPRAPLSTPTACGTYASSYSLTPWSTPYTPTVTSTSPFTIAGCTGNPFAPAFSAGNASPQAGQFSALQLQFSRNDNEQGFDALEATLAPGLLAKLAGVPECGEAELNAAKAQSGECPAASQLGTVTVAAGPGTDPFVTTGRVYLTGGYNGGPFGEAVVVPAVAGPFNLGNVVVRGSIRVNPTTAQGVVVSDPFPSILDGIPLQTRSVHVSLERPGFTFNATSCEHMAVTGTLVSTAGAAVPLSSPYQAAACAAMPFKPVFTASTSGRTSKRDGASLEVKISSTGGPEHAAGVEEANIAKVDLTIPEQLPSRLTTLQKACTEAQFNANPAGCPAASDIATAIVHTPLLASPLAGPVYFVSHGGAAFPDTEIVLQGEGVRLVLDGHTQIKRGVTYSRFESVPDAPFSTFEFYAPQGKYSIFGANGNLCKPTKTVTVKKKVTVKVHGRKRTVTRSVKQTVAEPLTMPTEFVAQNGAELKQDTKIEVTGCPKAKAAKKQPKKKSKAKKK
jgi:hypothetical protein